jgi:transposase
MEKVQHIIGADLSKRTIDLFCQLFKNHIRIDNNLSGFKELLKWIKSIQIKPSELMIVMEHTGLYSFCFENFLQQHQISFTKSMHLSSNDLLDWFVVNLIRSMRKE